MAMSNPLTPAGLKNLLPDPLAEMCARFINALIAFPLAIYQWYKWAFDSSGNATVDFKRTANFAKVGDYIYSAAISAEVSGPGGRLLCNGQEVAKATYPELYTALGDAYGTTPYTAPVNPLNFKVPDHRDRFPVGVGTTYTIGATGGEAAVTLDVTQIPVHAHTTNIVNTEETGAGSVADPAFLINGTGPAGTPPQLIIGDAGGGLPHNNIPPFLGVFVYVQA